MYTNIPTNELKYIITNILNNDHYTSKEEKEEKEDLLDISDMILEQNYLQQNNEFYKQNEGLTMAAPTSATLAEIFIQHLEHTVIYKILKKHQIIDYYRDVDDILIIYNEHHTDIDNTLDEFNRIHPKIKFTIEKETQNKRNYLDLTVSKKDKKLTFAVYRKPTTTDSIIHNDSFHPNEHRKSAINYLINPMNTCPPHTNK
jgi:hypothetical protein